MSFHSSILPVRFFSPSQTGEEYYGDMMSIPKNTQLVVKRVPNYRTKTLRLEAGGKQAAQDALEGYGTNTGVRVRRNFELEHHTSGSTD